MNSTRRPGSTRAAALDAPDVHTAISGRPSIAFLGPRGTFSEAALRAMPASVDADLIDHFSVGTALAAVRAGEVTMALVPIENSSEGTVSVTLDELATGQPLCIVDEYAHPVEFALLARSGISRESITRVATHPAAEAQCRGWVHSNLPGASVIPAGSTAAAAAGLADGDVGYDAAIAPALAAEYYGLEVVADNIGDADSGVTRFVLVSRPTPPPPPTGSDKTTLVLYMRDDHAGALLEILTEFAVRGVNLTRIESRPTKVALGDYFFVVDAEGHVDDERLGEAMTGLHRVCATVRYLGSYPRHDGHVPAIKPGTTDADFRDAESWLEQVRRSGHSESATD